MLRQALAYQRKIWIRQICINGGYISQLEQQAKHVILPVCSKEKHVIVDKGEKSTHVEIVVGSSLLLKDGQILFLDINRYNLNKNGEIKDNTKFARDFTWVGKTK
ncbi:hypothetical protein K2173_003688 [Erythroxylum novogranatense]|uniref:Uncharacterized protein n=1 Tax=Erythroxylum novogranatense TaxID=1862640 RepID=A0AAV8TC11_9ROSI|nr:hypothetical protein K2173_003688 [Erythroxylum novogranatense]